MFLNLLLDVYLILHRNVYKCFTGIEKVSALTLIRKVKYCTSLFCKPSYQLMESINHKFKTTTKTVHLVCKSLITELHC